MHAANSVNEIYLLELLLENAAGSDTVAVAHGCGSLVATIEKQMGSAWEEVSQAGCDDGGVPLLIPAEALFTERVEIFLGALEVDTLDGVYRVVLDVRTAGDGALLPEAVRTSPSFTITDTALYPTPQVFGNGNIFTGAEEYRITFTPDGSRAYFARSFEFFPLSRQATIYETRRVDGIWTESVVASFSGVYTDIDPFITPDGSRLYFSSIRPVDGAPRADLDVWYVEREGDGWGEPVHTGALNSSSDELYPSVAGDGTLYVGSDRPGGLGGWDLWRAAPAGTGHGLAENVGAPVNTPLWEFNPAVSPDGQTLVFTGLNYPGGAGLGDLYFSHHGGSGWGTPTGVGAPVNTAADEYHPSFSPDRRLLFFIRREVQGDLFVVSWPITP